MKNKIPKSNLTTSTKILKTIKVLLLTTKFLQPQNFLPLFGPHFVTVRITGFKPQAQFGSSRIPLETKEP